MTCQPEIAYLHDTLVAVQNVGGLQIPMQDPVLVQIRHSAKDLVHYALGLSTRPTQPVKLRR